MLDVIRKNAGSWLIKIILGAIVVVFVFWGVGSFTSSRMDVVATVNGEKILLSSYRQAYNNTLDRYNKMFGGKIPQAFLKQLNIKQQVLNSLVDSMLIRQEAARLGIVISDREVQNAVMSMDVFRNNGVFNKELYKRVLASARMSPVEFEESVRKKMEKDRLLAIMNAGLTVPESEALEHYMYSNQEIDISYAMITSGECSGEVNVTDKDIVSWYENHQDRFMTQPRIRLRYILFDRKRIASSVNVTETAIETYYKGHADEFTKPEMRKAAHILLRVPKGAEQDVVDKKKKEIEKIREDIIKGADFAEVAKEKSEDPGNASEGGDLGLIKRGMMVKPFEEVLFAMKEGEISMPVRTLFGWHIIKLEKIEPATSETLEQVRSEITQKLKYRQTAQIMLERANHAYDMIIDLGGLDALAKEEQLEVRSTDIFDKTSVPPEIGANPAVIDSIFTLQKGELSSLLEVPDGVIVAEVIEKISPHVPELDNVRDKAKEFVITEQSRELCRQKAEKLLASAKQDGLDKAAQDMSVEVMDTGFFKRTDVTAGELPSSVIKAAAGLFKGKRHPDSVVENGTVFYVLEFKSGKQALSDGFAEEKEQIKEKLLRRKGQMLLDGWLADKRKEAVIEQKMKL